MTVLLIPTLDEPDASLLKSLHWYALSLTRKVMDYGPLSNYCTTQSSFLSDAARLYQEVIEEAGSQPGRAVVFAYAGLGNTTPPVCALLASPLSLPASKGVRLPISRIFSLIRLKSNTKAAFNVNDPYNAYNWRNPCCLLF